MRSFHGFSFEEIKNWLSERKEKPFRSQQIFDWVYQKKIHSWDEMTNLSKSLRVKLEEEFSLSSILLNGKEQSKDLETEKFLWELEDEKFIESVLIYAPGRSTVCVSSQVGCPARCAFCASGKEGLIRNLSASEIFEQVYQIDQWLHQKQERVSHVVFMGMGEPLENYQNVIEAIRLICDPLRLNISERKITVSTVGVIEGIQKLTNEDFKVNLVLSLHAPNQHLRKKIIPYARKYELKDILKAMQEFSQITKRDITYEYTLLDGINDQKEHALELSELLFGQQCTVNLIPYNPVDGLRLKRPEKEAIEEFRQVLVENNINTTWRYTKGKDIAAACGQLALKKKETLFSIGSLK